MLTSFSSTGFPRRQRISGKCVAIIIMEPFDTVSTPIVGLRVAEMLRATYIFYLWSIVQNNL
jgi:hypothetical protein